MDCFMDIFWDHVIHLLFSRQSAVQTCKRYKSDTYEKYALKTHTHYVTLVIMLQVTWSILLRIIYFYVCTLQQHLRRQIIRSSRSACVERPSCYPAQHRADNGHFLRTSQNCFVHWFMRSRRIRDILILLRRYECPYLLTYFIHEAICWYAGDGKIIGTRRVVCYAYVRFENVPC